jgi:hypothetical protein
VEILPADFSDKEKRAKEIWNKIHIIRNKCFGHLDNESEIKDSFKSG